MRVYFEAVASRVLHMLPRDVVLYIRRFLSRSWRARVILPLRRSPRQIAHLSFLKYFLSDPLEEYEV